MVESDAELAGDPESSLLAEIERRCRENPDYARRVGNRGLIELESSWGDEATILNTARVSTSGARLSSLDDLTDRDRELLYHLLVENHGTPFETVSFRWRVIAPIFVLRQWMRHRMCSFNEFSQRYRTPITDFYRPDEEACKVGGWRVLTPEQVERYAELVAGLYRFYEEEYQTCCERIASAEQRGVIPLVQGGRNPYRGRARELLRNAMPVACYSDIYWTVNFRSLMNFFSLRRAPDAQHEIRQYADGCYILFKRRLPLLATTLERVWRTRPGGKAG